MYFVDHKRISRFLGSFYVGIYFTGANYLGAGFKPELNGTNLCTPQISGLFTVCGLQKFRTITYEWPDEVIAEYISPAKKRFFIQTDGPIALDDIFNFYINMDYCTKGLSKHDIQTPILIAAWAGEVKKAEEYYSWAESFGSNRRPGDNYQEFLIQIRSLMNQPEKLRYNFFESVKALKLEKAAYQDIEGVRYKAKDEFEGLFGGK